MKIAKEIITFMYGQVESDEAICNLLAYEITKHLPVSENQIWHAGSRQKTYIRLMSGTVRF